MKKKLTAKPKPKTIATGSTVSYHYRSAIGHGTVVGVNKLGTTSANTRYSIRQTDHHPGEPAVVKHFGKVLTVRSKKK